MSARRRGRLGRGAAVALVAVLGLALFGTALPAWARAETPTTVGSVAVAVNGADAAPGVASAALVVLVAGLVLALSGRVTRVLAVLGVVLGGALAAASAAAFLADPEPALRQAAGAVSGATELVGEPQVTAWPTLALAVAVLAVLVGAALPWLAGSWQRVGRRYETAAATPSAGPDGPATGTPRTRAMDDWDALSRGDDPSAS